MITPTKTAPAGAEELVYFNGLTTKLGGDFNTVQLADQYTFGGRP